MYGRRRDLCERQESVSAAHKPFYLISLLYLAVYSLICSVTLTGSVKYENPSRNVDKYDVYKYIWMIPGRDQELCHSAKVAKESKCETPVVQAIEISETKTCNACFSTQIL
jgi:hypothetical protein